MAETIIKKRNRVIYRFTDEIIKDLADKLSIWLENPNNFWLGDFAAANGIHRQRFTDFAAKSEYFAQTLSHAKQVQETRLVKLGLSKNANPAMAIFALKNVAGWRDSADLGNPLIDQSTHYHFTKLNDKELIDKARASGINIPPGIEGRLG